jgi:ATP phosphoribosyltransferase regulatory subunit
MTTSGESALLPAGLADLLSPAAEREASSVERLIRHFAGFGYERVKPPLIEFESSLLAGAGAAVAEQTFRLMDPVSQRMLGLRADMTPQIARIAAFRLANAPRPLRLCYAGQVLRVTGSQLRPERQFGQVGAELIGSPAPAADVEVALAAAGALAALGIAGLTLDLSLPTLVPALGTTLALTPPAVAALRQALDRKDEAAVAAAAGREARVFVGLLRAAGPAEPALASLAKLNLPPPLAQEIARLAEIARAIAAAAPTLSLTIDPVEHRGYEYHSGLSFTLFAAAVRGELGRGGRYRAPRADGADEPATGVTLFMDTVIAALPPPRPRPRLYLPFGTQPEAAARLRQEGWLVLSGLAATEDEPAEARRLACTHLWRQGGVLALVEEGEGA